MQRSNAFDRGLERKAFELAQIHRKQRTQRQDGEQRQPAMRKIHAANQDVNAVIHLRGYKQEQDQDEGDRMKWCIRRTRKWGNESFESRTEAWMAASNAEQQHGRTRNAGVQRDIAECLR